MRLLGSVAKRIQNYHRAKVVNRASMHTLMGGWVSAGDSVRNRDKCRLAQPQGHRHGALLTARHDEEHAHYIQQRPGSLHIRRKSLIKKKHLYPSKKFIATRLLTCSVFSRVRLQY